MDESLLKSMDDLGWTQDEDDRSLLVRKPAMLQSDLEIWFSDLPPLKSEDNHPTQTRQSDSDGA